MAREVDVDVNLAELGLMDSLQIADADGTLRLAYSSPVNGEAMLRVGCDVSNSTSYSQMNRWVSFILTFEFLSHHERGNYL